METTALSPLADAKVEPSEFAWLFEYGIEMDPAYLNSPERLNGIAKRYGPAMVSGYELRGIELSNGRDTLTLVSSEDQGREVWGILYRIPRRLLVEAGTALDAVHPVSMFEQRQVRAQEIYRQRSIECVTYVASRPAGLSPVDLLPEQHQLDSRSARLLLRIGKRQDLPATYLAELAMYADTPARSERKLALSTSPEQSGQDGQVEQHTEPLPMLARAGEGSAVWQDAQQERQSAQTERWLLALSLYLMLLFVATLTLAVVQAPGNMIFVAGAAQQGPLSAPWNVLLYGLLGGCISGMVSLGKLHMHSAQPAKSLPRFVILTWFTRPYLGAILAALAYLLLNSGLLLLSGVPSQRNAIYVVVAAIAGLCEGRIFLRR